MPPPKPRTRSRVCLACRTLFDHGEDCRGKGHQTVSIVAASGRAKLDDEVWGPDSRARALRQAAKAGAGGGVAGSIFDGCSGCDIGANALDGCGSAGGEAILGALVGVVVIVIGALLGLIIYWIVRAIVRLIRDWMHKPQPHGALYAPPKPKKIAIAAKGVVRSGQTLATPWREGSAYGWAMELHERRVLGGGAMMRDARSAGFDVALDDGRVLRVPAGRIRVASGLVRVDADRSKLDELIAGIDRARQDEKTVFPYDFARALTIEEGDHVEVMGEITHSASAAAEGNYRTNAAIMEPVGVPYLRVEKAKRVRVLDAPPPVLDAAAEATLPTEEAEAPEEAGRRGASS